MSQIGRAQRASCPRKETWAERTVYFLVQKGNSTVCLLKYAYCNSAYQEDVEQFLDVKFLTDQEDYIHADKWVNNKKEREKIPCVF